MQSGLLVVQLPALKLKQGLWTLPWPATQAISYRHMHRYLTQNYHNRAPPASTATPSQKNHNQHSPYPECCQFPDKRDRRSYCKLLKVPSWHMPEFGNASLSVLSACCSLARQWGPCSGPGNNDLPLYPSHPSISARSIRYHHLARDSHLPHHPSIPMTRGQALWFVITMPHHSLCIACLSALEQVVLNKCLNYIREFIPVCFG